MESPLDATAGHTPSDDDRPAGEWLEGYWRQMAPWAIWLGFLTCIFCLWGQYWPLRNLISHSDITDQWLVFGITLLQYASALVTGYFSYQFGKMLRDALITQENQMLENAFVQLRRFLIAGMVTVAIWGLSTVSGLYSTLQILNNPESFQQEPLQSEE